MQGRQLRPGLARTAREMSEIPAVTQHSPSDCRVRNRRARAAAAGCPRWLALPARFDEHQQTRTAHQSLRHRQDLLLPAAGRAAALVTLLGNLRKERQRFLDPRGALAARQVVARRQQIVGDGNLGEHAMSFDDTHNPGARGVALVMLRPPDESGFGNENVAAPSAPALPDKTSRREMGHGSSPDHMSGTRRCRGRSLQLFLCLRAEICPAESNLSLMRAPCRSFCSTGRHSDMRSQRRRRRCTVALGTRAGNRAF